jgi:hypothetical protein
MIKFFRHIRQSLVNENKMGKYFKYAFGEIILVVIGILIALQINNWNEIQKEKVREQQLLRSLREEFKQNIDELEFDHELNLKCIGALKVLLNFDPSSNFKTRTLDSLIGQAYNFATFDPRLGVVNDLNSSGNLELIQDPKLRYALNQWTGELDDYKEDIIIRREYWIKNYSPLVNKYIPLRNTDQFIDRTDYTRNFKVKTRQIPKSNYIEFLTNIETDGALFDYYLNQSFVTINEENILDFLENTIKLIKDNIR